MLFTCHSDRRDGDTMKIDWRGIDLQVDYTSYADGEITIDDIRTIDEKGQVLDDLPTNLLTEKAENEILALVEEALDRLQQERLQGFHA